MSFLPGAVEKVIKSARLSSHALEVRRSPAALPNVEIKLPEATTRPLSLAALLTGAGFSPEGARQPIRYAPAPVPASDVAIPNRKQKRPHEHFLSQQDPPTDGI
jgi:hypothetical protein